jgi:hypothetical protein
VSRLGLRQRGIAALGVLILAAAAGSMTVKVDPASPLSDATTSSSYSPPRTPWGDPDLQGAFSNSDERGIPMSRPDGLRNFPLRHFPPDELARLNRQRNLQVDPRKNEWEQVHEPALINNSRPWLVSDPPDGKIPRTLEARLQEFSSLPTTVVNGAPRPWESLDLLSRCVSRGLPGSMMPDIFGNAYEIVQAPGVVVITYEAIHEARVVLLDGRPHVDSRIRTYLGDARGRFEEDSLVIETTNFNGRTPFYRSSERLTLVERFTPIAQNVLQWSVTLIDHTTWPRPWTFAMNLTRTSGRPLEFACHEGNYSMRNILAVQAAATTKPGN